MAFRMLESRIVESVREKRDGLGPTAVIGDRRTLDSDGNEGIIHRRVDNKHGSGTSMNVYDSLGEAYANHGDRELAIKNYEKSVQLNPNHHGAKEARRRLHAH